MEQREGHPVLSGLAALVGVGAVIGVILGGAALVGTKYVGLDGRTAAAENTATESLFLPSPSPTGSPTAPLVTLPGGNGTPTIPSPTGVGTNTQAASDFSLETTGTSFRPDAEIDLTGEYAAGEGAVLAVQRLGDDGVWGDFATVTATVTDGSYYTFIKTTHLGEAKFRMWDESAQKASNVVSLTIG